jgi:hypothetical protein
MLFEIDKYENDCDTTTQLEYTNKIWKNLNYNGPDCWKIFKFDIHSLF